MLDFRYLGIKSWGGGSLKNPLPATFFNRKPQRKIGFIGISNLSLSKKQSLFLLIFLIFITGRENDEIPEIPLDKFLKSVIIFKKVRINIELSGVIIFEI
jgi:hypothetical protein